MMPLNELGSLIATEVINRPPFWNLPADHMDLLVDAIIAATEKYVPLVLNSERESP